MLTEIRNTSVGIKLMLTGKQLVQETILIGKNIHPAVKIKEQERIKLINPEQTLQRKTR